MDHFDRLETRDPASREQALMAALPGLIRHAQANAPGFAELLRGVDAAAITNRAALAQLPLVRKGSLKDLQRAVDVLRSMPNVDKTRIAYVGYSYGGAMGALFVGIERRLEAAVLVVADGGLVTHSTGPLFKSISGLPCARRAAWIRAMVPIEPIRFVGNANVPLLLQNGKFDEFVPVPNASELHGAAPEPKEIRWYDGGHGLTLQANVDRLKWLQEKIGLDTTVGGTS